MSPARRCGSSAASPILKKTEFFPNRSMCSRLGRFLCAQASFEKIFLPLKVFLLSSRIHYESAPKELIP